LNFVTMYRSMLYYLTVLWCLALLLSFLTLLPFSPQALLFSTLIIFLSCYLSNKLFEKILGAITNFESTYISALILSLIITPSLSVQNIQFAIVTSVIAMASKYIFAFNKKHIFNPVAIGVFIPSLFSIGAASWWVGTPIMNIGVLIGGILLTRKIQRFDLVLSFLGIHGATIILFSLLNKIDAFSALTTSFLYSSILFLAFVMLTEPSTNPPKRTFRIPYAAIVGVLSFFQTLEIALLIGNIFSYILSSKKKLSIKLKEKREIGLGIYEFIFEKDVNYSYQSGQYLEWTIKTKNIDSRGNRRYFTLSSSPTEEDLKIGIKIYEKPSNFKKALLELNTETRVLAGNLAGDFVLPKNPKNLVFIAGGIGITPFRSMIKYLLDKNITLPITVFYSNKLASEIVYKDIFDKAEEKLNIKTVYNLTDESTIPDQWSGYKGRINDEIIKKEVPQYKSAVFYLSGPHSMVVGFEETLIRLGISTSQIKKDFFPGYV